MNAVMISGSMITGATMTGATMTNLTTFLSPRAMYFLGWALLHFLWQGTALAALAAAGMALCRRPSARYAVAVSALGLMLMAPFATAFFYSQHYDSYSRSRSGAADSAKSAPLGAAAWEQSRIRSAANGSAQSSPTVFSRVAPSSRVPSPIVPAGDVFPWLVEAWLFGVALFSLRSAGGFFLLERNRRRQSVPLDSRVLAICLTLQRRLGVERAIDYCECRWLQAPAVVGWFRPVIFLPVTVLTGLSQEQLQSVIAHELAHIQRFDAFVNVFQVCVETLLFYHPAVWWLNKRIRAEREHCCDETAVALCGNAVEYARALTLMEEWRSVPALAMAGNRGPLTDRIVRVLGLKTLGSGMRGFGLTTSFLCLTAALVAGGALLGMARPRPNHMGIADPVISQSWTGASLASAQPKTSAAVEPAQQPAPSSTPTPKASPAHPRSADEPSSSSYIDSMKSVGLGDLSVDQLIALKIQGVTADYIRGLQEQGLHFDVQGVIAMRVQGITPEFVQQLHAAGLAADEQQIIALKIQGGDGEYYRQLIAAGIHPDIDSLIALKIQGVTPEYVQELHAAGLSVTAEKVIALKIQDVTPEYLKAMHDLGVDPGAEDAIALRVQDVTPEYVRAIHALGLNPSLRELIAMRVQDVTPEYIKGMQAAGYKFDVNQIIRAKVQDVTPEFIEQAMKHGFKDLTLEKLIQLRQLGILESKADL